MHLSPPSVEKLRKASSAIYIAVEANVAADISQLLTWAANQIEKRESQLKRTGVCMSCIDGNPDPMGCTDCLNTGWEQGAPQGYVSEALFDEVKAQRDALNADVTRLGQELEERETAHDRPGGEE